MASFADLQPGDAVAALIRSVHPSAASRCWPVGLAAREPFVMSL